jgi:hypothetical protein
MRDYEKNGPSTCFILIIKIVWNEENAREVG